MMWAVQRQGVPGGDKGDAERTVRESVEIGPDE